MLYPFSQSTDWQRKKQRTTLANSRIKPDCSVIESGPLIDIGYTNPPESLVGIKPNTIIPHLHPYLVIQAFQLYFHPGGSTMPLYIFQLFLQDPEQGYFFAFRQQVSFAVMLKMDIQPARQAGIFQQLVDTGYQLLFFKSGRHQLPGQFADLLHCQADIFNAFGEYVKRIFEFI